MRHFSMVHVLQDGFSPTLKLPQPLSEREKILEENAVMFLLFRPFLLHKEMGKEVAQNTMAYVLPRYIKGTPEEFHSCNK